MSKLSGKYLVLDIGHAETKILEVSISGTSVTVLNAFEMRDMSTFIVPAARVPLNNIEGFVLSLVDTLKTYKVTTSRLLVCSSIMALKTATEDWSNKMFPDEKTMTEKFNETKGRATSNIKINDWQQFGAAPSEVEIKFKILISTGEIAFIESFIRVCRESKLAVVSIEDTMTALCGIEKLYKSTWDVPSRMIVDVGETAMTYYGFRQGTFLYSATAALPISSIVSELAKTLNKSDIHTKRLLYTIGAVRSEGTTSELYRQGVEPTVYFTKVQQILQLTLAEIRKTIMESATARAVGVYSTLLTGGFMDIPGAFEYMESLTVDFPLLRFNLGPDYSNNAIHIKNKTNANLSSKFAPCVGICIKNVCKKVINLVPPESARVDINKVAVISGKALIAAMFIGIAVKAFPMISHTMLIIQYAPVKDYMSQVQSQISTQQGIETKYKNYIEALNNVDGVVSPLLEFAATYPSSSLMIASLDTVDMLGKAAVTEVPSDSPKVTDGKEVIEPIKGADDTEIAVEPEGTPEGEVAIKKDIIIRGYASDSRVITDFYSELEEQEFIPDLFMTGVKQVKLPSEELIYIFEMQIRR